MEPTSGLCYPTPHENSAVSGRRIFGRKFLQSLNQIKKKIFFDCLFKLGVMAVKVCEVGQRHLGGGNGGDEGRVEVWYTNAPGWPD
jgi:hypothetical protein